LIILKNKIFLLIINPNSGTKQYRPASDFIVRYFKDNHIILKLFYTKYKGHARDYCQNINPKLFSTILIYGGDGTFNEVINGILSRSDHYLPNLGFLPGGSGNAVMHHLNKLNVQDACKAIIKNKVKKIDMMEMKFANKKEYSINILGWGMVTDIGILSEKIRWLGTARYTIASLFYILKIKKRYAHLLINNKKYKEDYLFVLIANTKYTGKGMLIAPDANLDDGLLDLIIVKNNITKFALIQLLPKLFTGDHIESQYVEYKQVKSLEIIPEKNECLNIDGEIYGITPVTVEISNKKLPIYFS
tara:strand:+ start:3420 stop:4328 length:909 start_codon:yes stop_codon:yes gene_type:complete